MEMKLDRKQIRAIFLFAFKMSLKTAETARIISNVFGRGTANELTVQWWFKKFCKGDDSREDQGCNGQTLEFDSDQVRVSSRLVPL